MIRHTAVQGGGGVSVGVKILFAHAELLAAGRDRLRDKGKSEFNTEVDSSRMQLLETHIPAGRLVVSVQRAMQRVISELLQ